MIPYPEVLRKVENKIFVVSLPRTGTKSLIKMCQLLGFNAMHCPSIHLESKLENIDVFADTPIYCPSVFKHLNNGRNRFIYIDRSFDSWLDSFQRMRLDYSYLDYRGRDPYSPWKAGNLDRYCLSEIFQNANNWDIKHIEKCFKDHRNQVLEIENLLVYKFQKGWDSLCWFLDKDVPEIEIPHINKDCLFDKI